MISIQNRVFTRVFALTAFAVVAFLFINIAQAQAATLTAEEFVATDGSYKGVSVGFRTEGFGTATAVTVTLTRDDATTVTKTANQGVLDIINSDTVGGDQLTTPFVIQEGGFTEASDTVYWNPAPAVWTTETRPVSVTITVTDENGETFVTNSTFNDGEPSWPTYESLLTSATPGYEGVWYVDAANGGDEDGSAQHPYNTLEEAIAAVSASDVISIASDLHTSATVIIDKDVTIEGNGNTLFPEFVFTNNSNNTGLLIIEDGVTVSNLVIDGIGGTSLHGIHIYTATGVMFNNVTVKNNDKSGMTVNGSTVTVNNVSTLFNTWGGINVDQGSAVTTDATLTITGTSFHAEAGPSVWVDDVTNTQVSVNDTNAQYTSTVNGGGYELFVLKVVKVRNEQELQTALTNSLINNAVGSKIEFANDIDVNATVSIARPSVTLNGANFTLLALAPLTGHVMLITGNDVTVMNLVEDGANKYIHGLQAYVVTNISFENVTAQNNGKSGMTVNGSTVTVTNIKTFNNGWGGINVDQGVGVTEVTTLTVNGTSAHTETGPHIWRDDNAKTDVSVVDTNAQYDSETYEYVKNTLPVTGTKYFLKAPVVPTPTPSSSGGGGGNGKKVNLNDEEVEEVVDEEETESPEGEVLGEATTTIPVMYYTFLVDFGYGTENQDVMNLHTILINLGYLDIPAPTGWYGPMTVAAVKQYQASKGIIQTGYVGPLTRAQLNMTPVGLSLIQQQIAAILVQIAALQAQLEALNEEPGE